MRTVDSLTSDRVGEVLGHTIDPQERRNLQRLEAGHSVDAAERKADRAARTGEAKAAAVETRSKIKQLREGKDKPQAVLAAMWQQIGMPDMSDSKPEDQEARLRELERDLAAQDMVVQQGDFSSAEALVESCSEGEALRGLWVSPDPGEAPAKGLCQLLDVPAVCKVKGSAMVGSTTTYRFSQAKLADRFEAAIKSSGSEYAASVSFSGFGAHASAGSAHAEPKESAKVRNITKTSSAGAVMVTVVPMASFQMPESDMRLCRDAQQMLEEVVNRQAALAYLKNYGSHVSGASITLGGVYLFKSIMTSRSQVDRSAPGAGCGASGR